MPIGNSRKGWKKSKMGQRKRKNLRRVYRTMGRQNAYTHLFKRQTAGYEITNTSTIGVVATSDGNQIGLSTPAFESSQTGGGAPYRFGAVCYFKLSNVLQASDLTALYDRYKIVGIKWKIIPLSNMASVNGQGLIPTMLYKVDYDDTATPILDQDLRVKAGCKEVRLDRPRSIYFKPKIADTVLGSSGSAAFAVPRNTPYLNMSYPDVPHYGLKLFFRDVNLSSSTGSSINTCFRVETTYYVACKDPQ